MNIIDKKFNELTNYIKEKELEEVYNHIKEKYLSIPSNIQKSIEDFFEKFPYWGKLNTNQNNYEELYNRSKSLKEHIDNFIWLYNNLNDYRSKKLLLAIMNNWYNSDFKTLNNSIETNYTHYFDLDLVNCDNNEVFVDIGAYTGDTVINYINNYGTNNYKQIYCYEMTKKNIDLLKNNLKYYKNIKYIEKAISSKKETVYINNSIIDSSANTISKNGTQPIEATTIDDDIKEKISLIKMDIEGSEQKALIGCKRHIIEDHPKLLISVYHNHTDIWKIPQMIYEMDKNYKFYLRNHGNNIFPTETVLIGIYEPT